MTERNTGPDRSPGSHPIGAPAKKRPAWLLPLLGLIVAAIVIALLLSRCGGSSSDPSATTGTAATTPAAVTTSAASPTVSATTDPAATTAAVPGATGTLTADGAPLLPMTDATKIGTAGNLSAYTATTAAATAVAVQSVPADEGFWVGSSAADRVWVQLTGGSGESPVTVKKGDAVSFTGKVVKNTAGFAAAAGVTDAEGKKLLTAQGQHIVVARKDLTLSK